MTHKFNDVEQPPTSHASQMLFHGPVIYVDEVYGTISSAPSDIEKVFLSVFVKERRFAAEREYRFAVWSEDEPSPDPVILDVSLAMLASLEQRAALTAQPVSSAVSGEAPSAPMETELESERSTALDQALLPSLLELADRPGTRVAPHPFSADDLPRDLHEVTTTYSAVKALRHAVDRLARDSGVQAASSAWHAEPCIRRLCAVFEDPIRTVRVTDDNFIAVAISFPAGSESEAEFAFGPRGMSTSSVRRDKKETLSRSRDAWVHGLAMTSIIEELEAAGARLRSKPRNAE